jgi:predicted nucleic acid-binding protein
VTVIVVDASVLVPALVDDDRDGDRARSLLRGQGLVAPQLIDLEFVSTVRRQVASGRVLLRRAVLALRDLQEIRIERAPHSPFVNRVWELRDNLTPYDAAYVAVAEALHVPLFTADRGIAGAPGIRCEVRLVG